jgi:hypothetical protein
MKATTQTQSKQSQQLIILMMKQITRKAVCSKRKKKTLTLYKHIMPKTKRPW